MIGQLAIKIAGRESGKHCVIVDKIDSNYVLIDGNVRRKKCNINHLELLNKKLDIKKGASTSEVHKAMEKDGIKIIKLNPKKETGTRPRRIRKMSQKEEQKSKIIEFQVLNQKVQQLQEHLQSINNNIQEHQILRNSLDELENIKENQDILIPLGQGIFVKGIIKNNNELITNVGLNIMVEKDVKETKDMVKVNILNLSKMLERTEEEMNRNIEELQKLQKEITE